MKKQFIEVVDKLKETLDRGGNGKIELVEKAFTLIRKLREENIIESVGDHLIKFQKQFSRILGVPNREDECMSGFPRITLEIHSLDDLMKEFKDKVEEIGDKLEQEWKNLKEELKTAEQRLEEVKNYVKNAEKYSKETLRQVLKTLEPYKIELGKWYEKLELIAEQD